MLDPKMYVKQYAPEIDMRAPVKIRLEEGGENVTYVPFTSNQVSKTNCQFNGINPNNAETIVDRKIMVRLPFRITFTGTGVANGGYLLPTQDGTELGEFAAGTCALRAFPLAQMTASLSLKMNANTFTQTINDYIEPLMRYSAHRDVSEQDFSMTPTMQDAYPQYGDYLNYGSAKNALGNYGENGYETPRGGFVGFNIISQTLSTGVGDVLTSVADVEITEYLFMSPLAFGKRSHRGFYGVKTMQVTLNFDPNFANYIWSNDPTVSTFSNVDISFNSISFGDSSPQIMFAYYTPRNNQVIEDTNLYPYHNINNYTQDINGTVAGGAFAEANVNNIQLDSIPKRMYVFLRKTAQTRSTADTDTYARITQIDMNFANQGGIFSATTEQQLYSISVTNGYKSSWSQWKKFTGSVLCIDFARNVSMYGDNIVGRSTSVQLRYKINYQNITNAAIQYTINTVIVSDGYLNIDDESIYQYNNLGDIHEIYDSPEIHEINWETADMFYGAGIADKLREFYKVAKKGYKYIEGKLSEEQKQMIVDMAKRLSTQAAVKAISALGPAAIKFAISYIPVVGPALAQAVGFSKGVYDVLKDSKGGYNGAGIVGGKKVSKRKMIKRM